MVTDLFDGSHIGAQDAYLSVGGNVGVMPYISMRGNMMNKLLKRLWHEEEGQDLVEYGLLVVLVALFAITAMKALATGISSAFASAATSLSSAS